MTGQVLIVGAGPVGLALAAVLAKSGVSSTIVEKRSAPTSRDQSRAIVWMPKGLELLQSLGLADAAVEHGCKRTRHGFEINGKTIFEMDFRRLEGRFKFSLQMPQHDSEQFLEGAALASGLVTILRDFDVSAVGQGDSGVWAEAADGRRVEGSWGVGCDGARSLVRSALGIQQTWRDYGSRSAVADFDVACDLDPTRSFIALDHRRPWGMFNFAPSRWRLIYRLNADETDAVAATDDFAAGLLAEKVLDCKVSRVLWTSAFRLGQGRSETYRSGRWILAGDAAHAMGPSAGAGMMVGLIGAWRLGVGLGTAIRDRAAPDAPLADYEAMQVHTVARVQAGNAMIFRNLALTSPALARIRNFGLGFAGKTSTIPDRLTRVEALIDEPTPPLSGDVS